MENFAEYLNNGVEIIVKQALKSSFKNPLETAFIMKYMSSQLIASKRRLQTESEGLHIPPFLIASISAQCNLFCSGCYARANKSCGEESFSRQLSDDDWARIFREAAEMGVAFILLAGGEPLLRKNVISAAAATLQSDSNASPVSSRSRRANASRIETGNWPTRGMTRSIAGMLMGLCD